jgi:hypothetical protein
MKGGQSGRYGRWRSMVVGVAIVASLASGVLVGGLSAAAKSLSAIDAGSAPTTNWNNRLLDTNGPENYGH